MKKPLLEVKNLSVSFKMNADKKTNNNLVINDLSIKAYPGEILTIVGSSGSGKSILAQAILGLLPNNAIVEGQIFYDGMLIDENLLSNLRGNEIAFIPQSISYLDPLVKVGKQVRNYSDKIETIKKQREIFKDYDLCENAEKLYPFQLSGGMARRVLISTAVMENPKIIIADEPTPGLDMESAKKTMDYFKNFAAEAKAVILITHDIELAINYSDKLAIFYAGHIVELTNANYFKKGAKYLRHPYTKALYESLPSNGFKPIEGLQPETSSNKGCAFKDRCKYKQEICDERVNVYEYDDEMVKCNYDFRG
jgi:peptide/nickel transport system ATP-binding protein